MSSKPVVLYGASGYTGRLIAEFLREYEIPFVAAGRNREKIEAALAAVPGIETADYEIVTVNHEVDALAALFADAEVVCNTVGPFLYYGETVVQACLQSNTHYLDTGGEIPVLSAFKEKYSDAFAAKNLVLAPSVAYMFSIMEIAAHKVLETDGIDSISGLCAPTLVPTYGSFQTIFAMFKGAGDSFYLKDNQRVLWPPAKGYEVSVPGRSDTLLAHPWGGGTLPLYFDDDPRVRNVRQLTATADRALMEGVLAMQTMYEEEIKHLSDDEQSERLKAFGEAQQPGMPPRENRFVHRCIDIVHGSGAFNEVKCTMRTAGGYLTTGALQAATAYFLLNGGQKASGFTSACGAVGYKELYGQMTNLGLVNMQLS
jgi:hypothetical protein